MKSVRPGLYIGSKYDALYLLSGEYRGVTHLLSVVPLCHDHKLVPSEPPRDKGVFHKAAAELYMKHPDFDGCITRKMIPLEDSEDEELLEYLDEALRFIDDAREKDGIVLVHCGGGVSRSGSIVTAYLMWKEKLSRDEALQSLRKCSPRVEPNRNFMKQLKVFEGKLFEPQAKNTKPKDSKQATKAKSCNKEKKSKSRACKICNKVAPFQDFLFTAPADKRDDD